MASVGSLQIDYDVYSRLDIECVLLLQFRFWVIRVVLRLHLNIDWRFSTTVHVGGVRHMLKRDLVGV